MIPFQWILLIKKGLRVQFVKEASFHSASWWWGSIFKGAQWSATLGAFLLQRCLMSPEFPGKPVSPKEKMLALPWLTMCTLSLGGAPPACIGNCVRGTQLLLVKVFIFYSCPMFVVSLLNSQHSIKEIDCTYIRYLKCSPATAKTETERWKDSLNKVIQRVRNRMHLHYEHFLKCWAVSMKT